MISTIIGWLKKVFHNKKENQIKEITSDTEESTNTSEKPLKSQYKIYQKDAVEILKI